jgi:Family of unknown function (DUF5675)
MIVTVTRRWYSDLSIIGTLDIDGVFQCYTEEPHKPVGDNPQKPYCIPAGTYPVKVLMSPHFGVPVPTLFNVPGFEDIEIHNGNYPRDTHGCTLVGQTQSADFVGNSLLAFGSLMAKLPSEFEITYVDTDGQERGISA